MVAEEDTTLKRAQRFMVFPRCRAHDTTATLRRATARALRRAAPSLCTWTHSKKKPIRNSSITLLLLAHPPTLTRVFIRSLSSSAVTFAPKRRAAMPPKSASLRCTVFALTFRALANSLASRVPIQSLPFPRRRSSWAVPATTFKSELSVRTKTYRTDLTRWLTQLCFQVSPTSESLPCSTP